MSETRPIPLVSIVLDGKNPRLETEQPAEPEAIKAMLTAQGEKIVTLAADIIAHGVNLAERFVVMPAPHDSGQFVVLEGNRRVAALKVLGDPNLIQGALPPGLDRRLRELGTAYRERPVASLDCVVVQQREEAAHWIELRHTGEREGAGIVRWGTKESSRFLGRQGRHAPAMEAIAFVEKSGKLDAETLARLNDIRITNLERLLKDRYVSKKLGVQVSKGQLLTNRSEEDVVKGLARVVRDLAHRKINVSQIDNSEQRRKYVDGFSKSELPPAGAKKNGEHRLLVSGLPPETPPAAAPRGARPPGSLQAQTTLVPRNTSFEIADDRLREIFRELKKLKVQEFPNSAAVLLRVFLELGVDSYLERNALANEHELRNATLRDKVIKAINRLRSTKAMTEAQLLPVKRALDPQQLLAASIITLHQYVHNPNFHPSPIDVKTAWKNLEPFLQQLCR